MSAVASSSSAPVKSGKKSKSAVVEPVEDAEPVNKNKRHRKDKRE